MLFSIANYAVIVDGYSVKIGRDKITVAISLGPTFNCPLLLLVQFLGGPYTGSVPKINRDVNEAKEKFRGLGHNVRGRGRGRTR